MTLLGEPIQEPLSTRVARAGRAALAGLILPPAVLALASMLGHPARAGVDGLTMIGGLAGFAATGWIAGRGLSSSQAIAVRAAGAFAAGGALVTPAFRALQGLSGREPMLAVVAGTLGGFALGFGLSGAATAAIVGVRGRALLGALALSTLGGGLGALLALLPYGWGRLGLSGPVAAYAAMAVAIVAFLGCIILPCRIIGLALDRATPKSLPE